MNYKLSESGQLAIVALFQKGLVLMDDVSCLLEDMRFKFDEFGELECTNPEICDISQDELDLALAEFNERVEA